MRNILKTWRPRVISVISVLLFFFAGLYSVYGQDNSNEKPIYIFFEKSNKGVIEGGKKTYYKPENRYPMDVGRTYIMSTYRFCGLCDEKNWIKTEFLFTFNPNTDSPDYREIEIKNFYQEGRILDQNWFDETPFEEIYNQLNGTKEFYLVDKNFLIDGKYVLLKVSYYDGEY